MKEKDMRNEGLPLFSVGMVHLSTGVLGLCKVGWQMYVLAIMSLWETWMKAILPLLVSPILFPAGTTQSKYARILCPAVHSWMYILGIFTKVLKGTCTRMSIVGLWVVPGKYLSLWE